MNNNALLLISSLILLGVVLVIGVVALRRRGRVTGPVARVVCVSGPTLERSSKTSADFHDNVVTLGRLAQYDIQLVERSASRLHAQVIFEKGQYFLIDQDSQYGTYYKQHMIPKGVQIELSIGDEFLIAGSSFKLIGRGDPLPVAPPKRSDAGSRVSDDSSTHEFIRQEPPVHVGGQAKVYRAIAQSSKQVVALKVLWLDGVTSERTLALQRRQFRQALMIGAGLAHPHVVQWLGGSDRAAQPYLAEEWLAGGSLQDRLSQMPRLSLAEITRIIGQCCDALAYLHSNHIVHCDVKPSNIMFDGQGRTRLIDFGISRFEGGPSYAERGGFAGTARYMSYEQATATRAIPQSDLYSLGVVAYEMLTGVCPFGGDGSASADDVLRQHTAYTPRPPHQLVPSLPEGQSRAVMRALEKPVTKRFATAEQMARAFGYQEAFHGGAYQQERVAQLIARGAISVDPLRLQRVNDERDLPQICETPTALSRNLLCPQDVAVARAGGEFVFTQNTWWLRPPSGERAPEIALYVNGALVTDPRPLNMGDTIRAGTTRLNVL